MKTDTAIVLAMFGTSEEEALPGLLNIRNLVAGHFRGTPVRIAFTSEIIRRIWRQRGRDPEYCRIHPDIPADILAVRGLPAVLAGLREEGFAALIVQPVYMAPAGDYRDLLAVIDRLRQLPVKSGSRLSGRVIVGRPVFGDGGSEHSLEEDIPRLAQVLGNDIGLVRQRGAALVYMGHGSINFPGEIYSRLGEELRRQYPETPIYIATMNEQPTLADILPEIRTARPRKILLKPLMITAGRHARRDMAGTGPDSWQTRLAEEGFIVEPVLQGLGEDDGFAGIFVSRIAAMAAAAGLKM